MSLDDFDHLMVKIRTLKIRFARFDHFSIFAVHFNGRFSHVFSAGPVCRQTAMNQSPRFFTGDQPRILVSLPTCSDWTNTNIKVLAFFLRNIDMTWWENILVFDVKKIDPIKTLYSDRPISRVCLHLASYPYYIFTTN